MLQGWKKNISLGLALISIGSFSGLLPQTCLADPALSGAWSNVVNLPNVSVHAALLPGGKILMSDGQSFAGDQAIVWDPVTNSINQVTAPTNIFCGAMEQMADGRILVVGGHNGAHYGLSAANIFDPGTESWTPVQDMAFKRWYPTATMLPDGRIIVTSGEANGDEDYVQIQEIYDSATNSWSLLSSAPYSFPYYPHVFTLPDGRLIVPATTEAPIASKVLDLRALAWTDIGGATVDGGSTVMYRPGKFLKLGTSVNPDTTVRPSAATAYVLDATQASPSWRQVQSMAFPRTYQSSTILPDGNVLVTGGGPTTDAIDDAHGILQPELWSPDTEQWTTLAPMSIPRLYHSIALLLPDARVLVSGGGRFDNQVEPTDQPNAEIYSPPYLFKGAQPSISSAPAQVGYGQTFAVITPDAARIAKVSLIRYGAVTHSINMGQRFVPLAFSVGNGTLTVASPANSSLASPGNYMLFLVDNNGVPSVAATVQVSGPSPAPGTPPPNLPPSSPPSSPSPVPGASLTNFVSYSGDYNQDGKEDILWRNMNTGAVYLWLMNGNSILASGFLGNMDLSWKIVGIGDFDGTGKRDIVWYNPSLGKIAIWVMNGFSRTGNYGIPAPVSSTNAWKIAGVADFDHTGRSDILWQNASTGTLYIWKCTSPFNFSGIYLGTADPKWKIVGTADVEGNGRPDIIWRNLSTGEVDIWKLVNDQVSQRVSLGRVSLDLQIAELADFNGDGKQDILWRSTANGNVYVWGMNGLSVGTQWYAGTSKLPWIIVGSPALYGHSPNDLLWLNPTTGSVTAWLGSSFGFAQLKPFASAGPGFVPMPMGQ